MKIELIAKRNEGPGSLERTVASIVVTLDGPAPDVKAVMKKLEEAGYKLE
jgi:hypothetical protein